MNQEDILNHQIATLRGLDEAVLRHLVLDMAVSAFSSPDGLAHQTMNLAKLAYRGMGSPAPQNGAAALPLPAPAKARLGRPPKKLQAAFEDLTDEGAGEQIERDMPDGILTRREAAARMGGVSIATLDRALVEGRLHRVKLPKRVGRGGPRIGIRAAEVDALRSGAAPVKPRRSPGSFRDWIINYAKRHRGVVIVRDLKSSFLEEHGKQTTGGKLYDELNDSRLFRKEGEGRFVLTGNAGSVKRPAVRTAGVRRSATVVRRAAVMGLPADILGFASQRPGGELIMREYTPHFEKKFGGAASRTGSIYGAISQLIKKGKLEKVSIGVYRTLPEAAEPAAANE